MNKIIFRNDDGSVSVITPALDCDLTFDEVLAKDVPMNAVYQVINTDELPIDRLFRNAWELSGNVVTENLGKSKVIAHEKCQVMRNAEMKPLDLLATIPAQAAKAEKDRQVIRDKYAVMQQNIDNCVNVVDLRKTIT